METGYGIRVRGCLDETWEAWFAGMIMPHDGKGNTIVRGARDQAALQRVLERVRDQGLRPCPSHASRRRVEERPMAARAHFTDSRTLECIRRKA